MPSQLYNNDHIEFIAARNFTYAGEDYKMGDEWDQDTAVGDLDKLVRSRYLYAVVSDIADKPRHWHHHVHLKGEIKHKLGLIQDDSDELVGSSLYNKPKQGDFSEEFAQQDYKSLTPWEETEDNGATLLAKATEAALTEQVLKTENDEVEEPVEETEPEELLHDEDHISEDSELAVMEMEEDERDITAEDLYDPADHSVDEVMEYLAGDISSEEYDRVVASEKANKKRKGIVNNA